MSGIFRHPSGACRTNACQHVELIGLINDLVGGEGTMNMAALLLRFEKDSKQVREC